MVPQMPKYDALNRSSWDHTSTSTLPDDNCAISLETFLSVPISTLPTQATLLVENQRVVVPEEDYSAFSTIPPAPDAASHTDELASHAEPPLDVNDQVRAFLPHIPETFQVLVDELRYQGGNLRQPSVVADGVMKRDPSAFDRAGVVSFKDYIDRAVDAGIVNVGTVNHADGRCVPWISLSLALQTSQAEDINVSSSISSSRPPSPLRTNSNKGQDHLLFQGLIDELRQHDGHPLRSAVAIGLLKRDQFAYTRAGVTTFKEFAAKAVAAGVVTLGNRKTAGGNPGATIYLTAASRDPVTAPAQPSPVPKSEPQSTPIPKSNKTMRDPSSFRHLVEEIQRWPIPRPNRIAIVAAMSKRHPLTCENSGCANFDEYFSQAMEAGIIELGESISANGIVTRWISLSDRT